MRLRSSFIVLALTLLAAACGGSNSGGSNLTLNTGAGSLAEPRQRRGPHRRRGAALLVHRVADRALPRARRHLREREARARRLEHRARDQSLFSPLHTRATSGLIHIEAPEDQHFTVEMLFTEWRLTNDCIGGYCIPDTKLEAYVDGTRYTQPISTIVLKKGEEIAIVIGSPPATIPSRWDCLANIDSTIENPAQCADFGQQVPT